MGRSSKGPRHAFNVFMPAEAAERVHRDAVEQGCHYNDVVVHAVCELVGVDHQLPMGATTTHRGLEPDETGLAQLHVRIPRVAADVVIAESRSRQIRYTDFIAYAVCVAFGLSAELPEPHQELQMTG